VTMRSELGESPAVVARLLGGATRRIDEIADAVRARDLDLAVVAARGMSDLVTLKGVNGDASLTFPAVSERDNRHGQAVAAASLLTIAPLRSADVHTGAPEATQRERPSRARHRIGLPEREEVGEL
jgi:hypothetical protein